MVGLAGGNIFCWGGRHLGVYKLVSDLAQKWRLLGYFFSLGHLLTEACNSIETECFWTVRLLRIGSLHIEDVLVDYPDGRGAIHDFGAGTILQFLGAARSAVRISNEGERSDLACYPRANHIVLQLWRELPLSERCWV